MATINEMCDKGLVDSMSAPHLTEKGRVWLRALHDLETDEVVDNGEAAADLVLSTSGLFR